MNDYPGPDPAAVSGDGLCDQCWGSGWLRQFIEPCPACKGTGRAPRDLSLLGLAERVRQFLGHIEDMSNEERVFLLGAFEGTAMRLRDDLRRWWLEQDRDGYAEALPALGRVMDAIGDTGAEAYLEQALAEGDR